MAFASTGVRVQAIRLVVVGLGNLGGVGGHPDRNALDGECDANHVGGVVASDTAT